MPKFEVTIKTTEVYILPSVDADSEGEAISKALDVLDEPGNKGAYHSDTEGSEEAHEL